MGVRVNSELTFQIGRDNDLQNLITETELGQQIDTLDHGNAHVATLAGGETNFQVPFGDVAEARMVYIETDGDIRITPGGGLATSAEVDGAGGAYPTGFAGGETLEIDVDNGGSFTVTFDAADQSLSEVINRINAAAALEGISGAGGVPATIARDTGGGELRIVSPTTGASSEVEIVGGTAVATLGLSAGVTNGTDASGAGVPLTLRRPASSGGSTISGLRSFLLATLVTTSITIDNLDSGNSARVYVALAGDVLANPPTDC